MARVREYDGGFHDLADAEDAAMVFGYFIGRGLQVCEAERAAAGGDLF